MCHRHPAALAKTSLASCGFNGLEQNECPLVEPARAAWLRAQSQRENDMAELKQRGLDHGQEACNRDVPER
jgi:hypothetical protein